MAPYRLVPLLCSVGFLNSPVRSPPGLAAPVSLPKCPLQAHGRDVGCRMLDAGRGMPASHPSPAPRRGAPAVPKADGRADSEVPPDPGASVDGSRSHSRNQRYKTHVFIYTL